jgi:multiple sugar transport system ATP-binding protein
MGRVAFDRVTKRFDDVTAVDDLSLEIEDREFLVLLGPSGCGKTTALRLLAGLEDPTSGEVIIGDRIVNDVAAVDRDIAMVFQSYALYPHMTVWRNIEFPLRSRRMPASERASRVEAAVSALGLSDLLNRKPAQLSGGQRQRVALARAIVRSPEVFLMDEPLSNLDAKLRVQTRAELVELQRRLQTTMVYVTHDQVEAMTMAQRMAILDQGVLQQVGAPQDIYARPANLFVARFIGNPPMNTVPGTVVSSDGAHVRETPDTTLGAGDAPGDLAVDVPGGRLTLSVAAAKAIRDLGLEDVVVGIRPEHARIDPDGPVRATVAVVEVLGHEQHVICRLPDGNLLIVRQSSEGPVLDLGTPVRVAIDPGKIHVFDAESEQRVEYDPAGVWSGRQIEAL